MYSLNNEEQTELKNKETITTKISNDTNVDVVQTTEASSNAKTENADSVNFQQFINHI